MTEQEPPLPQQPDSPLDPIMVGAIRHRLTLDGVSDAMRRADIAWLLSRIERAVEPPLPVDPPALSRTDPPRCDECGRVGYIVGVGADLRIGGHLDQRIKHPFRSGTDKEPDSDG